jgi:hypothetical protein
LNPICLEELFNFNAERSKHPNNRAFMFNKLFRWQRGRQKTGYDKMLLCGALWPIKFDVYLT